MFPHVSNIYYIFIFNTGLYRHSAKHHGLQQKRENKHYITDRSNVGENDNIVFFCFVLLHTFGVFLIIFFGVIGKGNHNNKRNNIPATDFGSKPYREASPTNDNRGPSGPSQAGTMHLQKPNLRTTFSSHDTTS